jgi:hypothetical protein
MLELALAAVLTSGAPSACPADPLVANARLKIVHASAGVDNYTVTVDVKNGGVLAQPRDTQQHLDLVRDGAVIGTQPVPALGGSQTYVAAFRVQVPHVRRRPPYRVVFRYVLDSNNAARANCTTGNDALSATL